MFFTRLCQLGLAAPLGLLLAPLIERIQLGGLGTALPVALVEVSSPVGRVHRPCAADCAER
jgi:hypothetical protein